MQRVYLDYAATTYIKDEVLEAMKPYLSGVFGNPSSVYTSGREAKQALEEARAKVADCLGARAREVYFTSGGTESNNWALRGAAEEKRRIVTTAAEHKSILTVCGQLEKEGCVVDILPVDRAGAVSPERVGEALEKGGALQKGAALVSVAAANNEVGTITPLREIAEAARNAGARLHTDAVAAAGHLELRDLYGYADMITLSAHKFYGPKGVGALVIKETAKLPPLLFGGSQERGRRAGTENVAGAAGMAAALALACADREKEETRLAALRDEMEALLRKMIPGVTFNGDTRNRLANYVNVCLPNTEARAALVALDLAGVECSAGSACTAGALSPSHVLLAMGLPEERAKRALRITLGAGTTGREVRIAAEKLAEICANR